MPVTFQQAYEAAIKKYTLQDWITFDPGQKTAAIYQEMRRMDKEITEGALVNASHSSEAPHVPSVLNPPPGSIPRQQNEMPTAASGRDTKRRRSAK